MAEIAEPELSQTTAKSKLQDRTLLDKFTALSDAPEVERIQKTKELLKLLSSRQASHEEARKLMTSNIKTCSRLDLGNTMNISFGQCWSQVISTLVIYNFRSCLLSICSVPIHVELCVIHAEILTIAHVLSTTHVHSRTFFRTGKKIFSSDHFARIVILISLFIMPSFLLFFYR